MRELSPFASRQGLFISCLSLFCAGFSLAACKASMKADASAKADTSGGSEVDFDAEGDSTWDSYSADLEEGDSPKDTSETKSTATDSQAGSNQSVALFGARHDLHVTPGRAATCQCLSVVLGPPSAPGLSWQGPAPLINRTTQLIVGISSQGVTCDSSPPAASYMGYQTQGADVIVQVEAAVAGRPLTQGAVIPRPKKGGRVLIEGSGNVPYGRALTGSGACVIQP